MESAAVLRPLNYSASAMSHIRFLLEGLAIVPMYTAQQTSSNPCIHRLSVGGKPVSSPRTWKETLVSCIKTPGTAAPTNSGVPPKNGSTRSLEKNSMRLQCFPVGLRALVLEVCDETQVAELKLKVGDFEMHLK